jgi:hypothetical protein
VDFVENAEDLVRIDRAQREIIVGIAAVVEVEAAQHVLVEQPCDDLLDVLRRVMVAGVDQHLRTRAGFLGEQQRHAPVGDVGRVERRLKRLVFDEHRLLRAEVPVQRAQRFLKRPLAAADAALAGVIRSVCKP